LHVRGFTMVSLYLTSMGEGAGKSILCAALGRKFKAAGRKVGFFKPVAIIPAGAGAFDKDAEFIKHALTLSEPLDLLCPVSLGANDFAAAANEKEPAWLKKIKEAFPKVSQGKDVVLVEGAGDFKPGSAAAVVNSKIAEALGAKIMLIVLYQSELDANQIASAAKALAGKLLGVLINAVPERRMAKVKSNLVPALEKEGIKVLGILPDDRALFTISVGELAEHLSGNILNSAENSGELVESVMVGAMSPDSALSYLNLKHKKAVITRGDRPDIQLAALQTSISCLVVTNNINPIPNVLGLARTAGVPVITVKKDTRQTLDSIEGAFGKAKFSHEKKVDRLEQLMEQNVNLDAIYQAV
jgi:BioD-like phosphotransacetylase family protein